MPETSAPFTRELGLADLTEVTRGVLNDLAVLERQLEAVGRGDVAERLRTESARQKADLPAVVVVAGEPCQGKSLLVNAVVSRPQLLPVDFDVSTGVHVAIRAGRQDSALVYLGDDETGRAIPVAEIADYVSIASNPGNRRGVRFVEVILDDPMLQEGLELVDTPGVGGLDAAHGRMTLAVLSSADALVFVLDATGPISAPELKFLSVAAERIDSVLLVLTKIDANPDWRTVMDENRTLLAQSAPALADAPVVPVSALLANVGLGIGQSPGEMMLEESNVREVAAWLVEHVAMRRRRVRMRNAARLGLAAAAQLDAWYDTVLASLSDARAAETDLVAEQTRLDELNKAAATWRMELHEDLSRSERALANELATRAGGVRTHLDQDIAQHWTPGAQSEIRGRLDTELAAVELDLQVQLSARTGQAARRCAAALGVDEVELPSLAVSAADRLTSVPSELAPVDRAASGRIARQFISSASFVIASPHLGLLRILMSAVTAKYDLDALRRTQEQQEARRLMAEALGQWQRDFAFVLGDAVRDIRKLLEAQFGDLVKHQLTVVATHLRELSSIASEQATRIKQRGELVERRNQMQAAAARLRQVVQDNSVEVPR